MVAVPLIPFSAAVMVACPAPCPRANPVWEIVAMFGSEEVQFTCLERFCVLPSV